MSVEIRHIANERDIDRRLVRWIMKRVGNPNISVRLWNGDEFPVTEARPVACMEFCERHAIFKLLLSPSVGFGESYSNGLIKIHGDVRAFANEVTSAITRRSNGRYYAGKIRSAIRWLVRGEMSVTITILETISTNCGWTNAWYTPVRILTDLPRRWQRLRSPSSTTFAAN